MRLVETHVISSIFNEDYEVNYREISKKVNKSSILVVGGGGSIGRAVTRELYRLKPAKLHVIDLSENNLVELVRSIRSSIGYGVDDFKTVPIDVGSQEFNAFIASEKPYDYIINLSALKHVRSEKDQFSLMRLTRVNIFNSLILLQIAEAQRATKFFSVSTDKAANPVNFMGASKLIMEKFLLEKRSVCPVSMARFANVSFSDGSLLDGFRYRIANRDPISAPKDISRYFISDADAAQLCILSTFLGEDSDIFFPAHSYKIKLIKFYDLAYQYINDLGYEVFECESENQARSEASSLIKAGKWPCYFFNTDTTGEKPYEEFYTSSDTIDLNRFDAVGIIKLETTSGNNFILDKFFSNVKNLLDRGCWTKEDLLVEYQRVLPEFAHLELGKNLDQRM